jgi:site-specific DNA-methyltransferase (adenine-specific)
MRGVLGEKGTMYVHLDRRAVHEAKVVLDGIFGEGCCLGEVIWVPGNGARTRSGPPCTHETILVYVRSLGAYTWRPTREPYAEGSKRTHFRHTDAQGRRYREVATKGQTYRYFEDEGRIMGSVWADCPSMCANSPICSESTGYPTQKPESLLTRIIRQSSNPGDCVADFVCGSGTTLVVAEREGRTYVGADIGEKAIETTKARLYVRKDSRPL